MGTPRHPPYTPFCASCVVRSPMSSSPAVLDPCSAAIHEACLRPNRFCHMSDFKFSCPHCHQHMQCDEQFSGREMQCPSCHVLLRIPPVPGKTAELAPE